MLNYHCSLGPSAVDWIFTSTHYAYTELFPWAQAVALHRDSHNGSSVWMAPSPITVLEECLNAAFMSLGSIHGEDGLRPDGTPITTDLVKGCLLPKSHVPWPVMLLFILVGLILFWFTGDVLLLSMQLRRARARTASLPEGGGNVPPPVGFMPWLKHAAQKDWAGFGPVHTRMLVNWHLERHDGAVLLAEANSVLPVKKRVGEEKQSGSKTEIAEVEVV